MQNLTALGKTVLLTTHYMDEAQHLADRVAVIAGGEIVAEGTPESLGGRETAATVVSFQTNDMSLDGLPVDDVSLAENGRVSLRTTTPTQTVHEITGWAIARNLELGDLTITRPSLEDVYLALTEDDVDE